MHLRVAVFVEGHTLLTTPQLKQNREEAQPIFKCKGLTKNIMTLFNPERQGNKYKEASKGYILFCHSLGTIILVMKNYISNLWITICFHVDKKSSYYITIS